MPPRSNNIIAILATAAVAGALLTFKMNRSLSHWTDAGQIRDSLMQSFGNVSLSTGTRRAYDSSSLINGLSSVNFSIGTMSAAVREGMTALQRTAEHVQSVPEDILGWASTSATNAAHALSPLLLSAHPSDTSTVEGQGGGKTTVDGVWELPNSIGTFREGALSGVSLQEAGLPSYVRNRLRNREYSRLATADTPWGLSFYNGGKKGDNPKCVPDTHSCDCNEQLANRSVCSEVAHRQKPLLYIASEFVRKKITTYDCPTVRCIVSPPKNYSARDRAFVSMLVYATRRSVIARFPPKVDPLWNKNVLLSLEPAARYGFLRVRSWHDRYGVDYHLTHRPNGNISHIPVSYAESHSLTGYRRPLPSFSERSNRTCFFTSNCLGMAIWRTKLLSNMSSLIPLHSFGSCQFGQAIRTDVERDWPECSRRDMGLFKKSRKTQGRNYAEKQCILKNSRVSIVIENTRESDYTSEKIFHVLVQGNVPVYKGAPNVKEYLPPDAAIYVDDFPSLEELAKYVYEVNNNERLWLKHTAWRRRPFPRNFTQLLMRSHTTPCTVCEHFADDAKQEFAMPPPGLVKPECLGTIMEEAIGPHHSIPVTKPLTPSGVDAILILHAPSKNVENLTAAIKKLWNEDAVVIDTLASGSISGNTSECLRAASKACGLFECKGQQRDACAQNLFVAWLQVRYALPNVLVVRGDASINDGGGSSWGKFLELLPTEYEAAAVGGGCTVGGGGGSEGGGALCSAGYMMSQAGARRMLDGGGVRVVSGWKGMAASEALLSIPSGSCG